MVRHVAIHFSSLLISAPLHPVLVLLQSNQLKTSILTVSSSAAVSIHVLPPNLHFVIVYDGALQRWLQIPVNTVTISNIYKSFA